MCKKKNVPYDFPYNDVCSCARFSKILNAASFPPYVPTVRPIDALKAAFERRMRRPLIQNEIYHKKNQYLFVKLTEVVMIFVESRNTATYGSVTSLSWPTHLFTLNRKLSVSGRSRASWISTWLKS